MTVDEMRDAVARCDEIHALASAERWIVPMTVFDLLVKPEWFSTWALYLGEKIKIGEVTDESVIRSRTNGRVALWRGSLGDCMDVEVAPVEGFDVDPSDVVVMYRWLGSDVAETTEDLRGER